MRIHRIRGDGNCLFASCGYHLKIKPCCLRTRVARVIRDYPSLLISEIPLSKWIEEAGYNPETYARHISRSGVMGTGIELAIISILYRRTIRVHQVKDGRMTQIAEYFPEFGRPISLLFSGPSSAGHYDALID
jgi:hypothetical protein|uniref:ubiquitinyl hydrolase 1 n=1 Tax=viral metagenome TaxID=1070528 RepID=A0A6C0IZ94_9ZZZZ